MRILTILALVILGHASESRAQNYAIDWYVVSSGAGGSTGGVYSISGTIGQAAVDVPMTNGIYALTGGFWSLTTVATEGAPVLDIQCTNNVVVISWVSESSAWDLQEAEALNNGTWAATSQTVTTVGTLHYVVVNPPAGNRFYRLKSSQGQ